jgi:deoxyribonuclease V
MRSAMKILVPHRWPATPRDARELQLVLAGRVIRSNCLAAARHVAGIDVGFERNGEIARAAVAVLEFPGLALVDCAVARAPARFAYVPGLLSFREAPVIVQALRKLRIRPDVLLCDGHGYAHPRRFGLACHVGIITGTPTIGVAKALLTGTHGPVPNRRGAWRELLAGEETIGAVLRSRIDAKPIYVSIGHKVDLAAAVATVMACTGRYRLPETTRWAHRLASSPAAESARIVRNLGARRARACG